MLKNLIFIFSILWIVDANQWFCKVNEDCIEMDKNAECIQSQCQCPPVQVFSYDKQKCINAVLQGEQCEESVQCNLMRSNAVCSGGVCKCQNNEIYVRGKCRILKSLDENCSEDIDCNFGYDRQSVYCNKVKKCDCTPDYYRRHKTICRRIMKKPNDPCLVDTDCQGLDENAKCIQNKCTNSKNIDFLNYINNKNWLKEDDEMIFSSIYNRTNLETQKIGDKCDEFQEPCPGLVNSICIGYCYCKSGYNPNPEKTICLAELGEKATKEEECNKKNIKFDKNSQQCICNPNFFADENLQSCRKPVNLKIACTGDSQCSPYNAKCTFENEGPKQRCQCSSTTELNEELELCVDKKGLNGPCKTNDDCKIENSLCTEDGICNCNDTYYENNGKCLTKIGFDCLEDKNCTTENTKCINKKCECITDYIEVKNQCFEIIYKVGTECLHNEQCQSIKGICQNNTCGCGEGYHTAYNKCYLTRSLGDECKSVGECLVPSGIEYVECRNSKCKCKIGSSMERDENFEKICVNSSIKNNLDKLSIIIVLVFLCNSIFK